MVTRALVSESLGLILGEAGFADLHAGGLGQAQRLIGVLDGLIELREVSEDCGARLDRNGRRVRGTSCRRR